MVDVATMDIYMQAHIEQAVRQLSQAQKAISGAGEEAKRRSTQLSNHLNKMAQYFAFFGSMTERAFNLMIESTPVLYGNMMEIRYEFERMAMSIGESVAPQIEFLTDLVKKLGDVVQDLPEPVKQIIGMIALFGSLLGDVAPIIGGFSMLIGGLGNSMLLMGATGALSLGTLVSTMGIAALAIAHFILFLKILQIAWDNNFMGMRYTVANWAYSISSLVAQVRFVIGESVNEIVHWIALAKIALLRLVNPWAAAWEELAENVRYAATKMGNNLDKWANETRAMWELTSNRLQTFWNDIYQYYTPGLQQLQAGYQQTMAYPELAEKLPSWAHEIFGGRYEGGVYIPPAMEHTTSQTTNITVNANVQSEMDLRDLAKKLADYYYDEKNRSV